jgi:hypothetical protein
MVPQVVGRAFRPAQGAREMIILAWRGSRAKPRLHDLELILQQAAIDKFQKANPVRGCACDQVSQRGWQNRCDDAK